MGEPAARPHGSRRPLTPRLASTACRAQHRGMEPARGLRMSVEEYLAFDGAAEVKHELVNGEVVAMAGAEPEHNAVCNALTAAVELRLRGRPCITFSPDQRILVDETGLYTYADLTVVCGPAQFDDAKPRTLLNPQVVFEVLSPSTEAYDRGAKFAHYRRRASLQEYVLVAWTERRVDHYQRADGGAWLLRAYEIGAELELPALGIRLPVAELYAKLDLLRASAE